MKDLIKITKSLSLITLTLLSTQSIADSLDIGEELAKQEISHVQTSETTSRTLHNIEANRNGYTIEVVGGDPETKDVHVFLYDSKGDLKNTVPYEAYEDEEGVWRLRAFGGYYTDKTLGDVITANGDVHSSKSGVIGVEIGRVIYKNFANWPLNIVAQLGISKHQEKGYQKDAYGVTLGIKAEWTKFPWDKYVRTKIDFMEGINYTSRVPYFEGVHTREGNDGRDSKLMNYLGIGIGFNMADLFRSKKLEDCYLGAYLYHRSGVFATISAYNNIKGGSNFQTIYVECSL